MAIIGIERIFATSFLALEWLVHLHYPGSFEARHARERALGKVLSIAGSKLLESGIFV